MVNCRRQRMVHAFLRSCAAAFGPKLENLRSQILDYSGQVNQSCGIQALCGIINSAPDGADDLLRIVDLCLPTSSPIMIWLLVCFLYFLCTSRTFPCRVSAITVVCSLLYEQRTHLSHRLFINKKLASLAKCFFKSSIAFSVSLQ